MDSGRKAKSGIIGIRGWTKTLASVKRGQSDSILWDLAEAATVFVLGWHENQH